MKKTISSSAAIFAGCVTRLRLLCLVLWLGVAAPGMAQSVLLLREAHFQIAAQPLPLAILEFSDQAGIQVISSGNEVANATTLGVVGRHRVVDAMRAILQGTGLQYTVLNEDTITIKSPRVVLSERTPMP